MVGSVPPSLSETEGRWEGENSVNATFWQVRKWFQGTRIVQGSSTPTTYRDRRTGLNVPTSLRKGIGLPCQLTADSFLCVLLGKPTRRGQGLHADTWGHPQHWEFSAPEWVAGAIHLKQEVLPGFVIINLDGEIKLHLSCSLTSNGI